MSNHCWSFSGSGSGSRRTGVLACTGVVLNRRGPRPPPILGCGGSEVSCDRHRGHRGATARGRHDQPGQPNLPTQYEGRVWGGGMALRRARARYCLYLQQSPDSLFRSCQIQHVRSRHVTTITALTRGAGCDLSVNDAGNRCAGLTLSERMPQNELSSPPMMDVARLVRGTAPPQTEAARMNAGFSFRLGSASVREGTLGGSHSPW